MFKRLLMCAIAVSALLPIAAGAHSVELKLAFFGSDRSMVYRAAIKPFVDAVNAEAKGDLEIVLYAGGVLGREIAKLPQAVIDGAADITLLTPGYNPERFSDHELMELPGLFGNMREATMAHTRLVAANALRGYDAFFVIGAYVTDVETIHSRVPITSIKDLEGKRLRVNNAGEAAVLARLGAKPVPTEITRVAEAISNGSLDGAAVSRSSLVDFGIKRVVSYHYFLPTAGAPLALVMNRQKMEELPDNLQAIIRKYSGEWIATRFAEAYEVSDQLILRELDNPQRVVTFPSPADLERLQAVDQAVIEAWAAKSERNRELLDKAKAEIAKLRAAHEAADEAVR